MTTQTRPTMPLTVGMPASIRNQEKHASGPPPDRTPKLRKSNFRPAERPDRCISPKLLRTLASRSYATRTGTRLLAEFFKDA